MDYEKIARLVEEAKAGQKKSFDLLYQETWKSLYFHAKMRMGNEEDAMDIVQDTYLEAFLSIKKLNHDIAFFQWLHQLLNYKLLNYFNRTKSIHNKGDTQTISMDETFEMASEFVLENEVVDKVNANELFQVLKTLPEKQQAVIIYHYYDDLSISEIARIEATSEGVIRKRLFDARAALKKN